MSESTGSKIYGVVLIGIGVLLLIVGLFVGWFVLATNDASLGSWIAPTFFCAVGVGSIRLGARKFFNPVLIKSNWEE